MRRQGHSSRRTGFEPLANERQAEYRTVCMTLPSAGAPGWTAARREAYANDLGQASSLVAVTARSKRTKADQDPAEWLPPSADAL